MQADGTDPCVVSTGRGRTTCAHSLPGDERIPYAATHLAGDRPPEVPPHDPRLGYVRPVFASYDIVIARTDGSDVRPLPRADGYDAEATVSPQGDRIVSASSRGGDLDLHSMALDGTDVLRFTDAPGYDGGAFHSRDGRRIRWRAPNREDVDAQEARRLLERGLVRPTRLEIWVMDADGTDNVMVTRNGAADFAPSRHPDGRRVVVASNTDDPEGSDFELDLVDTVTGGLERVTCFGRRRPRARRSDDFDAFPMFSPDGKRLDSCSNRCNGAPNETNVFVADWRD